MTWQGKRVRVSIIEGWKACERAQWGKENRSKRRRTAVWNRQKYHLSPCHINCKTHFGLLLDCFPLALPSLAGNTALLFFEVIDKIDLLNFEMRSSSGLWRHFLFTWRVFFSHKSANVLDPLLLLSEISNLPKNGEEDNGTADNFLLSKSYNSNFWSFRRYFLETNQFQNMLFIGLARKYQDNRADRRCLWIDYSANVGQISSVILCITSNS